MRQTRLFGKTLRDDPGETETPSHRLLLRAGMVQQLAAGIYSYAPLAHRSLVKIQSIIRQEMDAAGGQELHLPTLQPLDLWEQTGRAAAFGLDLLRLQDRRGRDMVVAPTHEEVMTLLVRQFVQSYRDLPVILYQIQTKFRDELRPRAGLIRVREFDMKDAYSFDADEEGLDRSYQTMVKVYQNIFARCALPVVMVEADSGAIGGKDSHEFILPTLVGDDTIVRCPGCGYASNTERAAAKKPSAPTEEPLPLEEVHTPGIKTIEELASFLDIPKSKTLKAVFYIANAEMVFVIVRGDLAVNEIKLQRALGVRELRLASDEEVNAVGLVAGFASPMALRGVRTIADDSFQQGANFVMGANKPDYHLRNANYPRDFSIDTVADIALVEEGHACLHCGKPIKVQRGIEVGHIFKLGTFYSEPLNTTYLDAEGQQHPPTMGCYGIGVGRLLAAIVEQHHDQRGMCLPLSVAPYHVYLVALNPEEPAVAKASEQLYNQLQQAGIEVLFDDRIESAGVKFNDADLLGFPLRVVVSPRNLRTGSVEVKKRTETDAILVPHIEAVAKVQAILAEG